VLLQTLRAPPPKGSLRELVLTLLIIKKEQIEYQKVRALAQAIVDQKAGVEAFADYSEAAFPWKKTQKKRDSAQFIDFLNEEIKRGPISIDLTKQEKKVVSKLRTKMVQAEQVSGNTWQSKADTLYKRMGPTIPTGDS
jgi:hypothetical protein